MPQANTVINAVSVTLSVFPWWLAVLLAFLALALAVRFYRETVPPIAGWRRAALITLRAMVLLLVIFGLIEPVLRVTATVTRPSLTAVVLDTSASMAYDADPARRRDASATLETLRSGLGETAAYFAFDTALRPSDGEEVSFTGNGTDIATAITAAAGKPDVTAVVLISDGCFNLGEDPSSAARPLGVSVHTIAVGSPETARDAVITGISVSPIGREGTDLPLEVNLAATVPFDTPFPITVSEDDDIVATGSASLTETSATRITLMLPLRGVGTHEFDVEIDPPGDENRANNTRQFTVHALKNTFWILIAAAKPSSDLAFLRRVIDADESFSLDIAVGTGAAGDIMRALPGDLDSYDAIIILDGADGLLTPSVTDALHSRISAGGGLWLLGSSAPGHGGEAFLRDMPFRLSGETQNGRAFRVVPTEAGRTHFVTSASTEVAESWRYLPPLTSILPISPIAGRGVILAEIVPEIPRENPLPAIFTGTIGAGKLLVMPLSGIWRWSLMMTGAGRESGFFDRFVAGALNWLTTETDTSPLTVSTGYQSYLSGETINFEARLFDNVYAPVSGAEITLVIDDNPSTRTILEESRPAVYTASLPGPNTGTHTYRATAYRDGNSFAETTGSFTVQEFSLEMLRPEADPRMMRTIAALTGGVAASPAGVDSVIAALSPQPIVERSDREYYPTVNPLIPFLILTLLIFEWGIRKYRGMI
ncbi:hypothetical protein ACFL5H_00820 [Candidatus Latescibacterota bacterium]